MTDLLATVCGTVLCFPGRWTMLLSLVELLDRACYTIVVNKDLDREYFEV